MTIDNFNSLPDKEKKQLLVDAEKIGEYQAESERYELFKVKEFFVEVKTSFIKKYRTILNTYYQKDLPLNFTRR